MQSKISSLAFHVKRISRNRTRPRPQHRIGGRRAVARQHQIRRIGIQQIVRRCHDVDCPGVDFDRAAGAPVAHEIVDLGQCFPDVVALDPVDRVDAFTGAARNHPNPANVASAAKQAECVRIGWCGGDCGCCESAEHSAPGNSLRACGRHAATCVPCYSPPPFRPAVVTYPPRCAISMARSDSLGNRSY